MGTTQGHATLGERRGAVRARLRVVRAPRRLRSGSPCSDHEIQGRRLAKFRASRPFLSLVSECRRFFRSGRRRRPFDRRLASLQASDWRQSASEPMTQPGDVPDPLLPVSATKEQVPSVRQPSVFSQSARDVTSQWSRTNVQKPFFLQRSQSAQSAGPYAPHLPSSAVHLPKRIQTSDALQSSPRATHAPSTAEHMPSSRQPSVGAQCAFEVGAHDPFRAPHAPAVLHPEALRHVASVPRHSSPTSSQRPAARRRPSAGSRPRPSRRTFLHGPCTGPVPCSRARIAGACRSSQALSVREQGEKPRQRPRQRVHGPALSLVGSSPARGARATKRTRAPNLRPEPSRRAQKAPFLRFAHTSERW